MNKKINLFGLINTVSSQTGLDPELVEKFVLQLFKEIEKELTASSCVKIEGLGMFKIIKSLPNDRILFLSHFENDKKTPETNDSQHEANEIEVIGQYTDPDDNNESEIDDLVSFYEESVVAHKNHKEEEPEDFSPITSQEEESYSEGNEEGDDEINDFLYEYKNHEIEKNKRKQFSKIRIIALLALTLIGIFALLVFLYPKEEKSNLSTPITTVAQYVSLENDDTIQWLKVIEAEAELDFVSLSQDFYGYGVFWPYIYEANKKEIPSPFQIKKGTIVKIPKLDKEVINKDNKESVNKADSMSNEIIKLRDNTIAPQ